MKTARPLTFKASYYADIEKQINRFFLTQIFKPLMDELKSENIEVKNSDNPLFDALQTGKIYYDGRFFRGQVSSTITKDLRTIGAKFNRKERAYGLPVAKMPAEIKIGVQMAESRMAKLQDRIIEKLDSITPEQYEFNFDYGKVADKINTDLEKTLKQISVPVTFTPEQLKIIKDQWGENLELYVKDWTAESILKMRKQITQNVISGNRAKNMEKVIMKEYGVSKNKARFLARQETSLLTSKIRETRYQDAGLFRYQWSTSSDERVRDRHKELDGKIFTWDNPPIIDEEGNKGNPGSDWNCRCVAIPVIE